MRRHLRAWWPEYFGIGLLVGYCALVIWQGAWWRAVSAVLSFTAAGLVTHTLITRRHQREGTR